MNQAIKTWGHDELAEDLVEHLAIPSRMIWTDMQMGPSGSRRPDVFTMQKSYSRPNPMTYEIKVSLSDFRSDVTSGKWQEYLKFSSGVYFCVPKGLITKNDIPPTTGLLVRSDKVWRAAKKPVLSPIQLPNNMMLKMLIDGVHQVKENQRPQWARDRINLYKYKKVLGDDVMKAIQDIESARFRAREIIRQAEVRKTVILKNVEGLQDKVRKEAEEKNKISLEMYNNLLEFFGFKESVPVWSIRNAYVKMINRLNVDSKLQNAERSIQRAMTSIECALKAVEVKDNDSSN